jgi:hypothetical protein
MPIAAPPAPVPVRPRSSLWHVNASSVAQQMRVTGTEGPPRYSPPFCAPGAVRWDHGPFLSDILGGYAACVTPKRTLVHSRASLSIAIVSMTGTSIGRMIQTVDRQNENFPSTCTRLIQSRDALSIESDHCDDSSPSPALFSMRTAKTVAPLRAHSKKDFMLVSNAVSSLATKTDRFVS